MPLPDGWREDAEFIFEYGNIGHWEREFVGKVAQKVTLNAKDRARFVRLAVAFFKDNADYKEVLL